MLGPILFCIYINDLPNGLIRLITAHVNLEMIIISYEKLITSPADWHVL